MARVYCAGPFFCGEEQALMAEMAKVIESGGHETYLAQRDGIESRQTLTALERYAGGSDRAVGVLHRLVFSLDIYHLLEWADVVVANLNGRVPDEGTVVEAALAWHAQKPLVYFKNDWRAPFQGRDNLMLTCLTQGHYEDSLNALPSRIHEQLGRGKRDLRAEIEFGLQLKSELLDASRLAGWIERTIQEGWCVDRC